MKAKKKELRVDYIGGHGPLTLAEEEAITQYLTKAKVSTKKADKPSKADTQHINKANR